MNLKINTVLIQSDIALLKSKFELIIQDSIVVVIDVLRASTTICAALNNGAKEIIPCSTIEEAREVYSRSSKGTSILGGERNGIKPEGFDLGNSPSEYSNEIVENMSVILTTTNGTRAIEMLKKAQTVLIGCFANITKIESKLISFNSDVILVCAGNNGKPSFEDTLYAGTLIKKLVNRYDNCYLNEESKFALKTFLENKDNMLKECYKSEHGKKLIELGFKNDIDLALKYDIYPVVPVFTKGLIKIL